MYGVGFFWEGGVLVLAFRGWVAEIINCIVEIFPGTVFAFLCVSS